MQRIVIRVLFLSLFATGCMRKINVIGTYSPELKHPSYQNIVLYSDSTFKFHWSYHMSVDDAWGNYSLVGRKIILRYWPNKRDTIQGEYKFRYIITNKEGIIIREAGFDTISRPYYSKNPLADRRPKEAIYKNGKLIVQNLNKKLVLYKSRKN